MKGQVPLIEAFISAVALLVAFNMMITTDIYQTKWDESMNLLYGRDILITADRLGKLHDYVVDEELRNAFFSKINSISNFGKTIETEGLIKNTVYVACDCTDDQKTYLQNILTDVKFNGRVITAQVCTTTLPTISTCDSGETYPDALVIWGYKDLTDYKSQLTDFAKGGNGIIEIMDIQNEHVGSAQQEIFGLKSIDLGKFPSGQQVEFLEPITASRLPYQSYKWFYHLPHLLTGTISEAIEIEGVSPCDSSGMSGNFKFQGTDRRFWICGTTSVYWDTNNNNLADLVVTPRNTFSIGNSNFFLNYIDTTDKIRISFKPDYKFNDFIRKSEAHNKLAPVDDDETKVLLSMGSWDSGQPIAGVIFNGQRTVWIADFSRPPTGLTSTGDDHKQLLASLIFSMSIKKTSASQTGQVTSYINVNMADIPEIYRIDLGISQP